MSTNVGAVDMELLLNSNPYNKGLKTAEAKAKTTGKTIENTFKQNISNTTKSVKGSGIESVLGKIGKIAAAAFSVKAIVNFGKECIDLGSDLAEVQNVVDVTFGNLNTEVNKFAENAITQFGLGQTVTKKYVGTFGAMSKAFGFSNKEALAMSETLTGLTGDVASFYNLSSDEAYTKLKSVFTGETESLKDLGVVMTQNALDQYALANGYGRTTAKMSEQEKVALRYKFVMDKLSLANGDFARTSDSWANQTRVLSLRFNELKATLGQGFINVFTPIVKGINWVLTKLQVLANAFKSFTEMIFGNAGGDNGSSSVVSDLVTDASNASDAVGGIGDSAKKSAKDLKSLASFDTAQVLKSDNNDSGSGGGSGGLGTSGFGDMGNSMLDQANSKMDEFTNKAKELFSIFNKGFQEGFGYFDWNGFKQQSINIKENLKDIFTSSEVIGASKRWVNTVILNLGRIVGSVASIGMTIADNLVGGFNKFLEQNKKSLQEHIVRMFDLSSRSYEIQGKFAVTVTDIFSVFRSDTAKQITADLLAIFTESFLSIHEIALQFGLDVIKAITEPINQNKEGIKQAIEGMFESYEPALNGIKETVQATFSKIREMYDTYVKPAFDNLKEGLTSILSKFLEVWNNNIKPMLDELGKKTNELWTQHLQPTFSSIIEFFGKLINGTSELWKTWIEPLIEWIIQNVVPVLTPIFQTVCNIFMNLYAYVADVIGGIFGVLGGLIDFIVGIFTGDWDKAWNGIKAIFENIWNILKAGLDLAWNNMKDIIKGALDWINAWITAFKNTISNIWNGLWNGLKDIASNIWNWITEKISNCINNVRNVISNVLNSIRTIWNNIWNGLTNIISNIWSAITNKVTNSINNVKNIISNILNGIKNTWDNIWNGMKTAVTNAFSGIWSGIKSVGNSVLGRN